MQKPKIGSRNSVIISFALLLLIGLFWTSIYSYLLFHSLAELFSIVVACGIFMLAWNSRRILDNNYFLFVGIAYLFIGGLDLFHTLAYKGMGVFPGAGTNLPTQLWIATRYLESISLLIAPLFINRKLNPKFVFGGYFVAGFILLGSIFYWNIFPECFVEGAGLTAFKKVSEYIISTILFISIVIMFRKRSEFDEGIFRLLIASVVLTIFSELAFTFYIHAYGLSNLLGHFLKIVSFYLIYRAVIVTGLTEPYAMLFRNLRQKEGALRYRIEFEKLVSDISSRFISLAPDSVDRGIQQALENVGRFAKADAGYVFLFSENLKRFSMTHLWRNENIATRKGDFQNLDAESMPWWTGKITRGEPVVVSSLDDLPDEAATEKNIMEPQGIRSLIDMPMIYLENVIGFLGFSCVNTHRAWSADEIALLKIVGQIITSALKRKENEEALHRTHTELQIRVKERTAELAETNLSLENEIAERKQTEEALRLDEARLEALVKLNQYTDASMKEISDFVLEAGVALTRSEIGFIGFMNEAETDMTIHAWSKTAMSQCSVLDKSIHFPVENAGIWVEAVKKREPLIINDYSLPHPQKKGYPHGHVKLSRFLGVPVFDRDKIVALVGMANKEAAYDKSDIRQLKLLLDCMWQMIRHKSVQEQLRQSKAMLQAVFDGIIDPIILLSRDLQVKIINRAAVEYYGVPDYEETIGKRCYEVFKKRSEPCKGCEVPAAILEGQNTAFEREGLLNPDRSERVFIYLLKSEDGAVEDVILRISDITERKQFEKQIIQSEKMASLGVLVSSIAHEINNPNNFISFNLPILKDYMEEIMPIVDDYAAKTRDFELFEMNYTEFREDVFSLLNNIEHGSQRITTFVSNLKELSRSSKKKRDMKWVGLKTVVESAVIICRAKIRRLVNSLEVIVPDDLPQIYTDSNAIEHILINLLVNAAQAADKEDSWIKVDVRLDETGRDRIIIEVRDNGCGIEKKDQKHIYDPFFTTKSVGEGTGLGLYVCHTLAEEIFGRIEFESQPGEGSSFRLILRDSGQNPEKRS
jgi:signal transduction histidine kinase